MIFQKMSDGSVRPKVVDRDKVGRAEKVVKETKENKVVATVTEEGGKYRIAVLVNGRPDWTSTDSKSKDKVKGDFDKYFTKKFGTKAPAIKWGR